MFVVVWVHLRGVGWQVGLGVRLRGRGWGEIMGWEGLGVWCGPGWGGGHCLFEGRYPKQNYRPQILCYHSPLSLSLLVYSPLFLRLLLLLLWLTPNRHHFPVILIQFTVIKTLLISNPGCFSWTKQVKDYCPHRVGPFLQPPSSTRSLTAPPFFLLFFQLYVLPVIFHTILG